MPPQVEEKERASAPEIDPAFSLSREEHVRLRAMFDAHYRKIWSLLRRLGLDTGGADDAAQQVFLVAARRIKDIRPGSERSFLSGTAVRVASRVRSQSANRKEVALEKPEERRSSDESQEALLQKKEQRELLDRLLREMDPDLRTVLVLAEFEGFGKAEIAAALEIPEGTAASRLRRAREDFDARLKRHVARQEVA